MISMFIDDELTLDEKVTFVEGVHEDRTFKDETIALLKQEQVLRGEVVTKVPPVKYRSWRFFVLPRLRPAGFVAAAAAFVLIMVFLLFLLQKKTVTPHRFVIYRPDAAQVEIAGNFTGWKNIPMKNEGKSGYWEVTLDIPSGEHRFAYILDGRIRVPDPTISARENDDFGGKNSILSVRVTT